MLFSIIFTTVFVTTNCLYSTFASPIMSNGSAVAGELLNLTHSLANYVPADQLCDQPAQWVHRVCQTGISDCAWSDTCCTNPARMIFEWKVGMCLVNTMCQNTFTSSPGSKEFINCVDHPYNNNVLAPDQQSGVYSVGNIGNPNPAERIVSVAVQTNLADAT